MTGRSPVFALEAMTAEIAALRALVRELQQELADAADIGHATRLRRTIKARRTRIRELQRAARRRA